MHKYVLDTSAIVTRFHYKDVKHKEVTMWFESLTGKEILLTTSLALTEISAAFKQCEIPKIKRDKVLSIIENTFEVYDLLLLNAKEAGNIAFKTGCRGCDSIFIELAKAHKAILVTKNIRQANSAKLAGVEVLNF